MLVAQDDRLAHPARGLELRLERLRRHLLTAGGDEQIFEPVGDAQEALAVQVADVAGVEPAILERGARGLLVPEVALHDAGALGEDLAVGGEAHLRAGHRRAARPPAPPPPPPPAAPRRAPPSPPPPPPP